MPIRNGGIRVMDIIDHMKEYTVRVNLEHGVGYLIWSSDDIDNRAVFDIDTLEILKYY